MKRTRLFQLQQDRAIELDLAPLLALMVKLVPILLLSSVFIHVTMIETELPQTVQNSIAQNDENKDISLSLKITTTEGCIVTLKDAQGEAKISVPTKDGRQDLKTLHDKLKEIKSLHPTLFSLEIRPDASVRYDDIVAIIDEARKCEGNGKTFQAIDPKTGKTFQTDLMFPDVIFADVLEG